MTKYAAKTAPSLPATFVGSRMPPAAKVISGPQKLCRKKNPMSASPLLKKRLAYSSVSQVSYVLFGLFLMTPTGFLGALLQIVFHAIAARDNRR